MKLGVFLILLGITAGSAFVSGQQRAGAAIEALAVKGQVHLLANPEGNALMQMGPQGVLVVDTMREQDAPSLLASIRAVAGDRAIRYIVNTHAHPSHTGGNLRVAEAGAQIVGGNFFGQLGQAGANRAFIVAHENTLTAMSRPAAA